MKTEKDYLKGVGNKMYEWPNLYKAVKIDPGFFTKTSQIQIFYGAWASIVHLSIGLAFEFAAVQVPQLLSPDSNIRTTQEEASWIVSVLPLFSSIGCLISGSLIDQHGRRIMIMACQGPMFIGWLYTSFAKTPIHIIIGRAITGIGCGMAMVAPAIYCAEISLPNMRGFIGSFPALAISVGIVIQAGLGQYFHWPTLCYIYSVTTIATSFLYTWLPESPYFVLQTKSPEEAQPIFAKFRGSDYNVNKEMYELIDYKENNEIRKLSIFEYILQLSTGASCKPFTLIMFYILIAQVSGVSCVLMWSVDMLTIAKSSYDVKFGNFLLAVTRLCANVVTSILLYRITRRPLAVLSAIGVSFACFTLGFYLTYHDESSLVPQIFLMMYVAFASGGYTTLPFLLAPELYPLLVRGILGGITASLACLIIYGTTLVYPIVKHDLGFNYTMVMFGGFSLLGAIFLYFFLPETKDLTLQEIEEYYRAIRPTLVSQRRILSSMQQIQGQSATSAKSSKSSGDKAKTSKISIGSISTIDTQIKRSLFSEHNLKMKETNDSLMDVKTEKSESSKDKVKIMTPEEESIRTLELIKKEESSEENEEKSKIEDNIETGKTKESETKQATEKSEGSKELVTSSETRNREEAPTDEKQPNTSKKSTE